MIRSADDSKLPKLTFYTTPRVVRYFESEEAMRAYIAFETKRCKKTYATYAAAIDLKKRKELALELENNRLASYKEWEQLQRAAFEEKTLA